MNMTDLKMFLKKEKKNLIISLTAAVIVSLAFTVIVSLKTYADNVQSGIAEKIVRLHIVANSNSFFISSTVWQHPQHYDFTSIPLEENDDNILTHYYILRKGAHHPLTELYIEELKKMFGKL